MVQEYLFPNTVSEALSILSTNKGTARIIAGGTDLMLELQTGKHSCEKLVDLGNIAELKNISEEDGWIRIGASVTCDQVAHSPLVREKAPALAEAARRVGSHQIRNVATVAGNVVTGNPGADTAVPLVALGAKAEVVTQEGVQIMEVKDMYAGICLSRIDSCCQIVTKIMVPAHGAGEGSSYIRLEQRKALSLPMLNVSCRVSLDGDAVRDVHVVMAPVGPGPQHATETEDKLRGESLTPELVAEAAKLAVNQANPRSSAVRGSREYRLAVLPVLVERAVNEAVANARA